MYCSVTRRYRVAGVRRVLWHSEEHIGNKPNYKLGCCMYSWLIIIICDSNYACVMQEHSMSRAEIVGRQTEDSQRQNKAIVGTKVLMNSIAVCIPCSVSYLCFGICSNKLRASACPIKATVTYKVVISLNNFWLTCDSHRSERKMFSNYSSRTKLKIVTKLLIYSYELIMLMLKLFCTHLFRNV